MWKYCGSIFQLGFFILYIIFPFFHFIFIHTFHFFFSCFSPSHTCPVSYLYPPPPLLLFSFSPLFKNIPASSHSLFSLSSSLSLSLSLSLDSRTFTSSLCDKKRKKRGIKRKNKRDGSFCHRSSSSPSQSKWVRWLLSSVFFFIFFFFFFFLLFCFYCYDLINFKIVFLSFYFDNLIMLEFRDVWEKDCCVCTL